MGKEPRRSRSAERGCGTSWRSGREDASRNGLQQMLSTKHQRRGRAHVGISERLWQAEAADDEDRNSDGAPPALLVRASDVKRPSWA